MLQHLWHSFQLGGWMMWVIFALGLPGVGAAGRFAWRGEHQLLASLRWLIGTLLASGWFGFFVGEQKALYATLYRLGEFAASDQALSDQRVAVLIEGTGEALHCVSGALLFVVLIGLLVSIGQRRFPLPNPAAVPR
jgi:biopolymer transport protein ExbB/TolQ